MSITANAELTRRSIASRVPTASPYTPEQAANAGLVALRCLIHSAMIR